MASAWGLEGGSNAQQGLSVAHVERYRPGPFHRLFGWTDCRRVAGGRKHSGRGAEHRVRLDGVLAMRTVGVLWGLHGFTLRKRQYSSGKGLAHADYCRSTAGHE